MSIRDEIEALRKQIARMQAELAELEACVEEDDAE